MTTEIIGVLAAVAAVLLTIFGVVSSAQSKNQIRTEKALDEARRWFERTIDELRKDLRDELRVLDDHMKQSVLALDVRLQNELKLLIDASHLRIAALESRIIDLDKEIRAIGKLRPYSQPEHAEPKEHRP